MFLRSLSRYPSLALLFLQVVFAPRPSVVAKASTGPARNFTIIYYDDVLLIAGRNFGNAGDVGGNTEPGLFVHSRQHNRWIQVLQISTAGGKFGKSASDNPEDQRKLRTASVGWDFTPYATRDYIDQPMRTSGAIAFPEHVEYHAASGQYELKYLTSWGVSSAETVLYVNRSDLVAAFEKLR